MCHLRFNGIETLSPVLCYQMNFIPSPLQPSIRHQRGFTALESVVMLFILVCFTMVALAITRKNFGWPLGNPPAQHLTVSKPLAPAKTGTGDVDAPKPEQAPASSPSEPKQ